MIDPIFTATFSAKSLSDLAKGELLKASQNLLNKATKAQLKYTQEKTDARDPLEIFRNNCLNRICDLQHEIILGVSDAEFIKKVLPLLLDHIGNIYEATTEKDLNIINMSLARIQNALSSYKDEKKRRVKIRMYAVLVSLAFFVVLGLFIWVGGSARFGISHQSTINILNIPVPILIWSIIGSCSAILYRFTNAGDKEINEPLRWLFARPLTGIIMGVISYLVIKVGLITIAGAQASASFANPEVLWLIAFLASFSDRFSESLLRTVVGKFGGDKEGELISTEVRAKSTKVESSSFPVLEELDSQSDDDASTEILKPSLLTDRANVELLPNSSQNLKVPPVQTNTIETNEVEVTQINNNTDQNR